MGLSPPVPTAATSRSRWGLIVSFLAHEVVMAFAGRSLSRAASTA